MATSDLVGISLNGWSRLFSSGEPIRGLYAAERNFGEGDVYLSGSPSRKMDTGRARATPAMKMYTYRARQVKGRISCGREKRWRRKRILISRIEWRTGYRAGESSAVDKNVYLSIEANGRADTERARATPAIKTYTYRARQVKGRISCGRVKRGRRKRILIGRSEWRTG